jgi:Subtilisin inhibitor-like
MKPLLTRAFARNVPTALLIAAFGLGTGGLTAGPALAQAGRPVPAPRAAAARTSSSISSIPGGPMRPSPWIPRADLLITIQAWPSAPVRRWTLTCGPAGGTLPHPFRACRVLSEVWDPFTPVRIGVMCPMIVYGPQITTISGWWHGSWISVRFSRTFSCEAPQWYRILSSFPGGSGQVNPGGPMLPAPPVAARR